MNHCDYCEYADECELADCINFCEDCRDYHTCTICYSYCKAGHEIECNNGFEDEDDYWSAEDEV